MGISLRQIAKEIVKAFIDRAATCFWSSKSPFAYTHGGITFLFQHFSYCCFIGGEVQVEDSFFTFDTFISAYIRITGMFSCQ